MVLLYLDIETYSPQETPSFSDKIIAIMVKEVGGNTFIWREWKSNEREILEKFYNYLKEKVSSERTVTIIGFNVLLFDRDFLAIRIALNNIDSIVNVFNLFKKIFWVDLRYCLYPLNKLSFKGLSQEKLADKLGIRKPKYSNKEIAEFYGSKKYDKIEEHIRTDIEFIENLSYKLRNEIIPKLSYSLS